MELSEKWLQKFEDEGFAHVYEWQDLPGTIYESHQHKGKVSIFITDGSCSFDISGEKKVVRAGERFDIPVGVEHSAVVGNTGWNIVVGEKFDEDF